MEQMKTLNGYEIVDAKARQDIDKIKDKEVDLSDYVTEAELTAKGYLTEHQSLDNYYTKAQTDSAIGEAISGIEIPEPDLSTKADLVHQHSMADITDYTAPDLTNYYTKEETDTAITNSKDAYYIDFSTAEFAPKDATAEMTAFAERWSSSWSSGVQNICAYMKENNSFGANSGWQPANVGGLPQRISFRGTSFNSLVVANGTNLTFATYWLEKQDDQWVYYIDSNYKQFTLVTTDMLTNASISPWKVVGAGEWTDDLNAAKEVYVRVKYIMNSVMYSSWAVFMDKLENYGFVKFATNAFASDGTPITWYYDGSGIYLNDNASGKYVIEHIYYRV